MSEIQPTNRVYEVHGRNGYYAIDEYTNRGMMRNVDAFKTRKQANLTAGHLNQAYMDGKKDALIGMTIPLIRDVEKSSGYRENSITVTRIPAGTMVKILGRDSAAWFQCEDVNGFQFDCQYCDLREELTN